MVQLPSSLNDKTNKGQKIFAFLLMAAGGFMAVKLINYVAPDIIQLFKNIWWLIGLGLPLFFIISYVVMNPQFVWGLFKTLSWKLTKWFIKMDPLSVMDRYADHLDKKLKSLETTKVNLEGKKIKLGRLIDDLKIKMQEALKKGQAAQKLGNMSVASLEGTKYQTDYNTVNRYSPMYATMEKHLKFLEELAENWRFSNEKLRYTIDAKRTEYETQKEMATAAGLAKEFLRGDTEAAKLYNESIKEFEIQVSSYIAKIEDFDTSTKTIRSSLNIEQQMIKDEGMNAIDKFNKGDLLLPDFSQAIVTSSILGQQPVTAGKFDLLKKKSN